MDINSGTPYTEGKVTKAIEKQTSKVPSTFFLAAAVASMATSLAFKCFKKKHAALFMGQCATNFLLLGVYNKIVKVDGHDKEDTGDDK